VSLFGATIPVVPSLAGVVLLALLVIFRRRLTRLRILALVIAFVMIALTQRMADYYFNHTFYDIQQNWHYVAYGLFSYILLRDLGPRGWPLGKIILTTFLVSLALSTFDEAFQLRVSRRIFDPGDIAKDCWGVLIGMGLLYNGENRFGAMLSRPLPLRHRTWRGYLDHPFTIWVLLVVFGLLFMTFGSLLSDSKYLGWVALFTLVSFGLFVFLFHVSQYRWPGRLIGAAVILLAILVGASCARHRGQGVTVTKSGMVMYEGVPIPFFDVMFHADGGFRLVDKKTSFNQRDRIFFHSRRTDIVVIGTGHQGSGGHGFSLEAANQFNYNRYLERGSQIIILPNAQAAETWNRNRHEGRRAILVLHQEV